MITKLVINYENNAQNAYFLQISSKKDQLLYNLCCYFKKS